ncbi:dCMP deaminase [Parelusimicrobium proximum]|uniref:deoxycytidylate deaminase n=1 Tax=Parelusimicrobium proximum TaxID=3228953 RepID=UPI003D163B18
MKNENKLFIEIATLLAEQSTCCRMHVGAVLVKENRIISMGFNGVPSKQMHCEDFFRKEYDDAFKDKYASFEEFIKSAEFKDIHGKFSNENELHAEQNAILFAAKNGIATQGASMYVTFSPCVNCAKAIIIAGIKKVYYKEKYDRGMEGVDLMEKSGIECIYIGENC